MVRAASTLGGEREGKKQAVTGIPQRVLTTAEPQSRNPAVRLKHVGNLATLEKTPQRSRIASLNRTMGSEFMVRNQPLF